MLEGPLSRRTAVLMLSLSDGFNLLGFLRGEGGHSYAENLVQRKLEAGPGKGNLRWEWEFLFLHGFLSWLWTLWKAKKQACPLPRCCLPCGCWPRARWAVAYRPWRTAMSSCRLGSALPASLLAPQTSCLNVPALPQLGKNVFYA